MRNIFKSFVANESGATAIEYALIASLIAVALVTWLCDLIISALDKAGD